MEPELLVFDLDDTLLTSDKIISPNTADAIKRCKDKGILIGYITARARPFYNAPFFIDNLPCDFIAYYNGAEIYCGDVSIGSNVISYEDAMKIINDITNDYAITQIGIYHEPWSYNSKYRENWNIITGEKIKCETSEIPHYDVQRIRIVFDNYSNIQLDKYMVRDAINFVTADGTTIIVNKNATKEKALKHVTEYFKVPLSNVIAFGDDINDIGMLQMAGIGVAMGNAIAAVKEISDYVTNNNDNDGIAEWINKYIK